MVAGYYCNLESIKTTQICHLTSEDGVEPPREVAGPDVRLEVGVDTIEPEQVMNHFLH